MLFVLCYCFYHFSHFLRSFILRIYRASRTLARISIQKHVFVITTYYACEALFYNCRFYRKKKREKKQNFILRRKQRKHKLQIRSLTTCQIEFIFWSIQGEMRNLFSFSGSTFFIFKCLML